MACWSMCKQHCKVASQSVASFNHKFELLFIQLFPVVFDLGFRPLTAPTHGGVRWRFNASAHSLWMGWRHASPHCIVGAKRSFSRGARCKSRAMFYFWSFDGSVSQSNHMPVQALANQTAACVSGAGDSCDWLFVERQTCPPASFNASRRV